MSIGADKAAGGQIEMVGGQGPDGPTTGRFGMPGMGMGGICEIGAEGGRFGSVTTVGMVKIGEGIVGLATGESGDNGREGAAGKTAPGIGSSG